MNIHTGKRPKIAFVTTYDATDARQWSGTGNHIYNTVQKYVGDVDLIGNLLPLQTQYSSFKKFWHKARRKTYDPERTILAAQHYARQIESRLYGKKFDLIFSPGTTPLTFLETTLPLVYWTDATFAGMINYYYNLTGTSIAEGHELQRIILERCARAIYSSQWAADSARDFYHASPSKIRVIPFGSNLSDPPQLATQNLPKPDIVRLLFIGKDFKRKGGSIAIEAVKELNILGVAATLDIVGCEPPKNLPDRNIRVFKNLDKNKQEDVDTLINLYTYSHFFLLPTRRDCTPIVFSEASAYGLPVISTKTGGVATVVREGINGYLLDESATGKAYAEKIIEVLQDWNGYLKLRYTSRSFFDSTLNWHSAGLALNDCIQEIL